MSLSGDRGLIVGRERAKPWGLLRYDGAAHLVTIAPTRSGKGAGAVIPNLLAADRSALVIDPKGENARVTARARARFGPVYVLDPFAVSGEPSAAFNPLADLDPYSLDLAEDVTVLADALVQDAPRPDRRGALERGGQGADRRRHPPCGLLGTPGTAHAEPGAGPADLAADAVRSPARGHV